jgi:hypothetical protein
MLTLHDPREQLNGFGRLWMPRCYYSTPNQVWTIKKNDDVRPTCPTYRIAPIGMVHVINELNTHMVDFETFS